MTLIPMTLVSLFSTVCFQMCPQIAFQNCCKIALVAFVCFFSTVRLQMSPQTKNTIKFIATLVAFVWFFSTVGFPQITTCFSKSDFACFFFRSEKIDVKILTHHYSLFLKHLGSAVSASISDASAHKELLLDTKSLG